MTTSRRWVRTGGLTLAVIWSCLVLPPVFHTLKGLCPVRPGAVGEARAVPAFARKYGIGCAQCHTAYPALNDYGREFKSNGYVRERDKETGANIQASDMLIPEKFPWGAVVKSRPYDKSNAGAPTKVRALHELELFVADGSVAKDFSYFTELEWEDEEKVEVEGAVEGGPADGDKVEAESETGFAQSIAHLRLGFHPKRYFNVIAAFDTFLNAVDPYQTLSANGTHMTRRGSDALGVIAGHHGAEQIMAVRGEVGREGLGGLSYAVGVGNDNAHGTFAPSGEGPVTTHLRMVADTYKGFALGGYAMVGKDTRTGNTAVNKETLLAVDALAEAFGVTARAAYLGDVRKPRAGGALKTDKRAGYVEAFYTLKRDEKPWIVPLLRYDIVRDRLNDRTQNHLVANLSYYLRENVRGFLEYYAETKDNTAGAGQPKDSRWTMQFEVGF